MITSLCDILDGMTKSTLQVIQISLISNSIITEIIVVDLMDLVQGTKRSLIYRRLTAHPLLKVLKLPLIKSLMLLRAIMEVVAIKSRAHTMEAIIVTLILTKHSLAASNLHTVHLSLFVKIQIINQYLEESERQDCLLPRLFKL